MELNHYHQLKTYPNRELIILIDQIVDAMVAEKLGENLNRAEFAMQKASTRVDAVLSIPDDITVTQATTIFNQFKSE